MNLLMGTLFFLLSEVVCASFSVLPESNRYGRQIKKRVISLPKNVKKNTKAIANQKPQQVSLKKIKEGNDRIEKLLNKSQNSPLIEDNSFLFKTGDVLKGRLLNSVVSTNLESPMLVEVNSELLPRGTKFSCKGVTKHKRVVTACNLMISEIGEYLVDVVVLNTDGSAGLKGTYYDGKESYIASSVAIEFAKGMMEVGQNKITSPLGAVYPENSLKNKVLQGMMNSSSRGMDMMDEEMKSKEPKVFINAGKEVLIFFNKRFSTKGELS